jgi:uncharacterized SAM-binding protein YcdF (DUF218 family)
MFVLKKLVSLFLLPPTGLLLSALFGVTLLGWTRWRKTGVALALGSVGLVLVLSTPNVAGFLIHSLYLHEPVPAAEAPSLARRADAIAVLSGGAYPMAPEYGTANIGANSLARLRYGVWLHRQTGLPMLVTGGAPDGGPPEAETMARILREEYAVEPRWIESASLDTRDNADLSAKLLLAEGRTRVVVVTDARHMRRAMAEFERAGMKAIAAPTGRSARVGKEPPSIYAYFPNAGALAGSSEALKEWLGILAIRLRGA